MWEYNRAFNGMRLGNGGEGVTASFGAGSMLATWVGDVSIHLVTHSNGQVFMVMELMDHDLKSVMDPKNKEIRMSRAFSVSDIKNLMKQVRLALTPVPSNAHARSTPRQHAACDASRAAPPRSHP